MAAKVGYESVLYNATGTVIACLAFDLKEAFKSYKSNGVFWVNQNLINNGKLSTRNLLGFIIMCLLQVIVLNMVLFTLYFSLRAEVNSGISTCIWSVTPFFMSFADYLMFGNKLGKHQIAGITLITCSIILLSLRDVINPPSEEIGSQTINPFKVSIIVPLIFAILTPLSFTGSAIYVK